MAPSSLYLKFRYSPEVATAKKLLAMILKLDESLMLEGSWIPITQGLLCFDPLIMISPPISIKKLFLFASI